MPRKTKFELAAESVMPTEGTEAFWRLRRTEASARRQMLEVQHRKILIDKMNGELIHLDEVRYMFNRVFQAYRQATREIDRRYGGDAASILVGAERSALRVEQQEDALCPKPVAPIQPKSATPASGKISARATKPRAKSASSRKKKS